MCTNIGTFSISSLPQQGQLPGLSIAFPAAICGVAALIAGILMYWVPETLYSPMHQTIEEVEAADPDFGIPCCKKRRGDNYQEVGMLPVPLDSKL